jgi:hypothetical protein
VSTWRAKPGAACAKTCRDARGAAPAPGHPEQAGRVGSSGAAARNTRGDTHPTGAPTAATGPGETATASATIDGLYYNG